MCGKLGRLPSKGRGLWWLLCSLVTATKPGQRKHQEDSANEGSKRIPGLSGYTAVT